MAKQTYSIGGLSLQQVQQVDAFLNGAQPGAAPAAPPTATAPPPMTTVAPPMPPTAAMPPAAAAAPPPPPPTAAPPPPPAATGGDLEIASAIAKAAANPAMGAKGAMELVKKATTDGYAEGHPKRGSTKYQDVPPEWKAWLIGSLTPAA